MARNDKTHEVAYRPVVRLIKTEDIQPFIVRVSVDGNLEAIETTGNHPFWINDHGWVQAESLEVGDQLITTENEIALVESVEPVLAVTTVYNIEVADFHTYYVGESGIWVHNTDCKGLELIAKSGQNELKLVLNADGTVKEASGAVSVNIVFTLKY